MPFYFWQPAVKLDTVKMFFFGGGRGGREGMCDARLGEYLDYGLQGCDTVKYARQVPTFQRNLLPPSSGSK
jgi:hypothetical protein